MPETKHSLWEIEVAEERLSQRHTLALAGKAARNKKQAWVRGLAEMLRKEIQRWHYKKRLEPSDIEVAWMIHSQIAWRGPEATEESLWEDLPETDPAAIIEAESEGPETTSEIPPETLLLLRKVLTELEEFGQCIKKERYSENWETGAQRDSKKKGGVKKGKWKYRKQKPLAGKNLCKSRLLSDFFELRRA
jgi:hypothetical protein